MIVPLVCIALASQSYGHPVENSADEPAPRDLSSSINTALQLAKAAPGIVYQMSPEDLGQLAGEGTKMIASMATDKFQQLLQEFGIPGKLLNLAVLGPIMGANMASAFAGEGMKATGKAMGIGVNTLKTIIGIDKDKHILSTLG